MEIEKYIKISKQNIFISAGSILLKVLLFGRFAETEDIGSREESVWSAICVLIFGAQCYCAAGGLFLLGRPFVNLRKMINNECKRRRLEKKSKVSEIPADMKEV